ncbi:hypothetical protein EG328_010263 [Venturia inaequalis]|uniref:DNA-directed RNA polymerases I, II, and III subunit RPABC1 n=2 Tax=Venturia inaequalis TaxID=5025 RepID=A0A8H3U7G9_VENIN|nr:hypothetical protein EG328_010263 [Venturia inaequalis]KAE9975127.1 hypothetical protein EG327_008541 [Venturia inaequalis]RDI77355.1 Succinyl-CoA:3-ketoacid coenzyme A transferase 1 [Venturia inaequalis]
MDDVEQINKETVKLWRVYRTALKMCQDRGYTMSDEELNITLPVFRQKFEQDGMINRSLLTTTATPSPRMIETLTEPPSARNPNPVPTFGTIRVSFNGDLNVGIKPLKSFVQACSEDGIHTGILITAVAPTSASLKITAALDPKLQICEIFQESELVVNITMHELVPKHVLLSYKEKKDLLERYRLKESQLPRIQRSDPVAKYFGLKRGQVVKIIRKSETAGRYASYRWCI